MWEYPSRFELTDRHRNGSIPNIANRGQNYRLVESRATPFLGELVRFVVIRS